MARERRKAKFDREENEWYVEPEWVSDALFQRVEFVGSLWDPCAGMCNVSKAAQRAGYKIFSTDLIDRGFGAKGGVDFFRATADTIPPAQAIVSNPPYVELERFIDHALGLVPTVAVFTQLNFLSAFKRHKKFTEIWPLATVYVLSKRPSCLPGSLIMQGVAPGGGEINYCWLIFDGALDETALDRPALGFLMPPKGVFQVRRKPGARRTRDDDD